MIELFKVVDTNRKVVGTESVGIEPAAYSDSFRRVSYTSNEGVPQTSLKDEGW
jgi:hypothetical protein